MKVISEKTLDLFRTAGRCEYCGRRSARRHPHHFHAKGMGGGSQLDIPENLIALCAVCHDEAHRGNIPRCDLLALIAARIGLLQDQVLAVIHETLREPKRMW